MYIIIIIIIVIILSKCVQHCWIVAEVSVIQWPSPFKVVRFLSLLYVLPPNILFSALDHEFNLLE